MDSSFPDFLDIILDILGFFESTSFLYIIIQNINDCVSAVLFLIFLLDFLVEFFLFSSTLFTWSDVFDIFINNANLGRKGREQNMGNVFEKLKKKVSDLMGLKVINKKIWKGAIVDNWTLSTLT